MAQTADRMRVGFYIQDNFQRAMLDPVYFQLKDGLQCLMTDDIKSMIDFKPRIVVIATHYYHPFREYLPETIIVWVRHGFSSKNNTKKAIVGCDFACVSSEWVRDDYIRRGWNPRLGYWITGFVPMDQVLKNLQQTQPFPDYRTGSKVTLLYAPTWNKNLSSVEVLGDRWFDDVHDLIPNVSLVIKPHPLTPERNPKWMRMWREAACRNRNTSLIEDAHSDIYEYLPKADILLSDVSSVVFYFLALDRPIILVNNPQSSEEKTFFDPDGPEWTWRDMGIEIERPEDLPNAVLSCLEHPDGKAEQRAIYRKRVFGDLLDGRASERIANRIRSLLQPKAEDKEWVDISWNGMAALASLESFKQQTIRMRLRKGLWRFFDRYPRLKFGIKNYISRHPRLQYAINRLLDFIDLTFAKQV